MNTTLLIVNSFEQYKQPVKIDAYTAETIYKLINRIYSTSWRRGMHFARKKSGGFRRSSRRGEMVYQEWKSSEKRNGARAAALASQELEKMSYKFPENRDTENAIKQCQNLYDDYYKIYKDENKKFQVYKFAVDNIDRMTGDVNGQ